MSHAAPYVRDISSLTSKIVLSEMFKKGRYKPRANEVKNSLAVDWATGMHFATTTMRPLTCDLTQFVPAASHLAHKSVKHLVSIWLECA